MTHQELNQMITYSVKKVYDKVSGRSSKSELGDTSVWNRLNLPKHRFIIWLAVQHKLQTTTRLARIGISSSDHCLICARLPEDHQHLFFTCQVSVSCLTNIKNWKQMNTTASELQQLLRWIQHNRKSKFKMNVYMARISALVYCILQAKNKVYWKQCVPCISVVCKLKVWLELECWLLCLRKYQGLIMYGLLA